MQRFFIISYSLAFFTTIFLNHPFVFQKIVGARTPKKENYSDRPPFIKIPQWPGGLPPGLHTEAPLFASEYPTPYRYNFLYPPFSTIPFQPDPPKHFQSIFQKMVFLRWYKKTCFHTTFRNNSINHQSSFLTPPCRFKILYSAHLFIFAPPLKTAHQSGEKPKTNKKKSIGTLVALTQSQ